MFVVILPIVTIKMILFVIVTRQALKAFGFSVPHTWGAELIDVPLL